ncbi:hypothetical protein N7492_004671 [Penicillium capsulatum]|uniref:Putative gamma-glutamylcyclotransferase n=1 Tax=Penicillium capsulatum TaxID=69766 RepID=A0A9W9IAE2_9EURO|nr:hypothetical protein N7492_004671 [Penicillium capsulatum]KAJ6136218.1 hypothetical protein N7512_001378 [Penicillium capsulatum]
MSDPNLKNGAAGMPPPPPPPPPENPSSKVSEYVLKLRTAPPDVFFQATNLPPVADPSKAPSGVYFFYGTLTDPSMVREILGLEDDPDFRPAYIKGFKCKLWGQYPALVDGPDAVVEGAAYHVQTGAHGAKLAAYETNHYCITPCHIHYSDEMKPTDDLGYTFKYQGNLKDLSDDIFDLMTWLRRMGRYAAVEKLESKKDHANYTQ